MKNSDNVKEPGAALFPVRCPECGEIIDRRFFRLNNLLRLYYCPDYDNSQIEFGDLVNVLGIGAVYGDPVLPDVDPIIIEEFQYPSWLQSSDSDIGDKLNCVSLDDNAIPKESMREVHLNISSIIAQFWQMTQFSEIYKLLEMRYRMNNSYEITSEEQSAYSSYCDALVHLSQTDFTSIEEKFGDSEEMVSHVLDLLLGCAEYEDQNPSYDHSYTTESKLFACWCSKLENKREMPYSLAVMGLDGFPHDCTSCCCGHCLKEIPYRLGAYQQKVIGLLGVQSSGKTTYLCALADMIARGDATRTSRALDSQVQNKFNISYNITGDSEWQRFQKAPDYGAAPGPLWLYQNGFTQTKTEEKDKTAAALTFLVESGIHEPVMYTIADIPGEAFYNYATRKFSDNEIRKQHNLLFASDALLMVIHCSQLFVDPELAAVSESALNRNEMPQDPQSVLSCYKEFLPKRLVPTAVLLTAADQLGSGDLRGPLNLAYDVRKISPVVWSSRMQTTVYNGELMSNTIAAVQKFVNNSFGGFADLLAATVKAAGGDENSSAATTAAFVISNGTQHAPKSYADMLGDEAYLEAGKQRYLNVLRARFGVAAPLIWLLARDGMLEIGTTDHNYNNYGNSMYQKYLNALDKIVSTI